MASEGRWGTRAHFSLTDLTNLFTVSIGAPAGQLGLTEDLQQPAWLK